MVDGDCDGQSALLEALFAQRIGLQLEAAQALPTPRTVRPF
jgi:hypothetical protein